MGTHNAAILLCNEVFFPERERLAHWMSGSQTTDSKVGGGVEGKWRGGEGSKEACHVILLEAVPFSWVPGGNSERSRDWNWYIVYWLKIKIKKS